MMKTFIFILAISLSVWSDSLPQTSEGRGDVFLYSEARNRACTGFVTESNGVRQLVTARHCRFNEMKAFEKWTLKKLDGFSKKLSLKLLGRDFSIGYESDTELNSAVFEPEVGKDIVRMKLFEGEFSNTKSYTIAKQMPQYRDRLTITGYPKGWPDKYGECIYLGASFLLPDDSNPFHKMSHKIFCRNAPPNEWINGISGAAVKNSDGEVVGVVSRVDIKQFGILFFDDLITPITPNLVIRAKNAHTPTSNRIHELQVFYGSKSSLVGVRGIFSDSEVIEQSYNERENQIITTKDISIKALWN